MNRRTFLSRLGYGAVATLALASVPASVVKAVGLAEPARRYACETLRRIYNDYTCGKGLKGVPDYILVGADLFDAYESELMAIERFGANGPEPLRGLKFKGATAYRSHRRGWSAECRQGVPEYAMNTTRVA